MPTISLRSSDGELFHVDPEVAKKCVTIKTMLDMLDISEDAYRILVSAPVPFGLIWVSNWVGIGSGGIGD